MASRRRQIKMKLKINIGAENITFEYVKISVLNKNILSEKNINEIYKLKQLRVKFQLQDKV